MENKKNEQMLEISKTFYETYNKMKTHEYTKEYYKRLLLEPSNGVVPNHSLVLSFSEEIQKNTKLFYECENKLKELIIPLLNNKEFLLVGGKAKYFKHLEEIKNISKEKSLKIKESKDDKLLVEYHEKNFNNLILKEQIDYVVIICSVLNNLQLNSLNEVKNKSR